ncbi:MAG TPA: hypothetical protein VHK69_03290, partial [Chitinophagaceae bacterium]|nr:hypothetical protein [Chitinophagaceae bacterium]
TDLNYVGATPKAFIANTVFAGNNSQFSYSASTTAATGWTSTELASYINRTGGGNTVAATTADAGLTAPFKYDQSVDFNAAAGSAAAGGADFTSARLGGGFFTQTTFRGAAGAGDTWWKGWTSFK